jgi:hypothetical protein
MAASKSHRRSGVAGRRKAARPIQGRIAGKHAPQSKPSADDDATMPGWKDDETGRLSRREPSPRSKPGDDERDSSATSESSERRPSRGSRWESADDQEIVTRPDRTGDAPLADDDEAPEGSER